MKKFENLRTQPLTLHSKTMLDNIDKYGLSIINVVGDDEGPSYSYSIGLFDNYKHPEIIVIGLEKELAQMMISGIAQDIKDNKTYQTDKEYDGILEGFKCGFKSVNEEYFKDYIDRAVWYYGEEKFPVLQCVWPDTKGNFPWDKNFDETLRQFQPILL